MVESVLNLHVGVSAHEQRYETCILCEAGRRPAGRLEIILRCRLQRDEAVMD